MLRGGASPIQFHAAGDLPATHYPKMPAPGTDEVLVAVRAAAINPVDFKVGKWLLGAVMGLDLAGVVTHVAEGSTSTLKVGDEVFGTARGSLADRVLAKGGALGIKPARWSFVQAAAVPTTYVTALQAMRHGELAKGGSVLIIGASGGCGTAGLQVAKALGCGKLIGVCSGKNVEYCKSHRADAVIDYTRQSILDSGERAGDGEAKAEAESEQPYYDLVYDCATNSGAGEDYKADALRVLRPAKCARTAAHGQYVAINGAVGMWLRKFTIGQRPNEHLFLTDMNTKDLDRLSSMDSLNPTIHLELPLDEEGVKRGFEMLKSRRAVGKIVFNMEL